MPRKSESVTRHHIEQLNLAPPPPTSHLFWGILACSLLGYWLVDGFLGAFLLEPQVTLPKHLLGLVPPSVWFRRIMVLALMGLSGHLWKRNCMSTSPEEALKQNSEWFSTALRSIKAGMIATDNTGAIVFMNRTAQEQLRVKLKDVEGQKLDMVCKLEVAEQDITLADLMEQSQQGMVSLPERTLLQTSEIDFPVFGGISPILDRNGNFKGAVFILQDLSLYHHMDYSHAMLTTAVHHAADAIVVVNTDGFIAYCNPAASEIVGIDDSEIIGKHVKRLRSIVREDENLRVLQGAVQARAHWRGELCLQLTDGSRKSLHAAVSPVSDTMGNVSSYVVVCRDSTREDELQHQLLQSQKMEVLGVLAGGIAHDFNNLLMVILNFSDLLKIKAEEGSKVQTYTKAIYDAAKRATGLTRQLLSFARHGDISERKLIDLNELLDGMRRMLQRIVPENIEVEITTSPGMLYVKADPNQLEQVLLNLVINARDALPLGGKISIWTEAEEGKGFSHKALLCIKDTGVGMSEDVKRQAFTPFFTTKPEGKGTGLGLSTVARIIDQHQAEIKIQSAPDRGTQFTMKFRLCGNDTVELHQPRGLERSSLMGSETILVVEDDPSLLRMITHMLEQHGCRAIAATGGIAGLELAKKHASEIDVVITDIMMPDMSGIELAKELPKLDPPIKKILLMTGYLHVDGLDEFLQQRGVQLLRKPFTMPQLGERIRMLLY